jgi:hypothetical protein
MYKATSSVTKVGVLLLLVNCPSNVAAEGEEHLSPPIDDKICAGILTRTTELTEEKKLLPCFDS